MANVDVVLSLIDDLDSQEGIFAGEIFQVLVSVADTQNPPQSVFSAYLDVAFGANRLQAQRIDYHPDFSVARSGTIQSGQIDEVGATANSLMSSSVLSPLLTLTFKATTTGTTVISTNAGEATFSEIVVYGEDQDQRWLADFGSLQISIAHPLERGFFSYDQQVRLQNPSATAPTHTIGGLRLAQLFDESYYLHFNPDVKAVVDAGSLASGYEHFRLHGATEGRNPSLLYNESYCLANNGDVAQAKANGVISSGLSHFLQSGHREGRDPSRHFDQSDYLNRYADIANVVNNGSLNSAFEHYIAFGAQEVIAAGVRQPALALFNEAYYLQQYADVRAAVGNGSLTDGFEHFVLHGQGEGRTPSPLFEQDAYLAAHPDVASAVSAGNLASAFEHFLDSGRFEGRALG